MSDDTTTPTVTVLTMGCRVNQFETDLIRKMGFDKGFRTTYSLDDAEVIIVNTCSVTRESESQARKLIRKIHRDHPKARIIVTGCYAQRSPETFKDQPNVELVVGNSDKTRLWDHWVRHNEDPSLGDRRPITVQRSPMHEAAGVALHGPLLDRAESRARSSLQVQDGCDRQCTYCLIPQVRGPSRSLDLKRIVQQVANYIDSGSRELVVLGIDLGAYGRDLSPPISLAGMVQSLASLCTTARLRLSSVDPMDVDDELVELLAPGSPLCPYLHLSIQSGDDLIRKRMGRRGSRREVLQRIEKLRQINPGIVLGADLIAGFPTESPEAFANTVSLVTEGGLAMLHVFPYSERPDTPAAKISGKYRIPSTTIRRRAALLRQAGQDQLHRLVQPRCQHPADVLVDQLEGSFASGKSEDFFTVRFANRLADPHGSIRRVQLVGFDSARESFEGIVPQLSTELSTDPVDNF